MAGSVNKVILIGNLGKDPEVRTFESGRKVVNFPLATSETFKDREGNKKEMTEWHNIAIWRTGLTDVAEKYLKKGSKVYIEGGLRTRSWEDQEKNTQYRTEINVDNLTMLGSQNAGGAPASAGSGEPAAASAPTSSSAANDSFDGDDDDLPF